MIGRPILFGLILMSASLPAAYVTSVRLNTSPSMPIGLYRITPITERLLRGQVVIACMNDTSIAEMALERRYVGPGPCLGNTEMLLKPVAAIDGDIVSISASGITVNDVPIENTAALSHDPAGRQMPQLPSRKYLVQAGQIWLLASKPSSFDSRYVGAFQISSVKGMATPLWVWP